MEIIASDESFPEELVITGFELWFLGGDFSDSDR